MRGEKWQKKACSWKIFCELNRKILWGKFYFLHGIKKKNLNNGETFHKNIGWSQVRQLYIASLRVLYLALLGTRKTE